MSKIQQFSEKRVPTPLPQRMEGRGVLVLEHVRRIIRVERECSAFVGSLSIVTLCF